MVSLSHPGHAFYSQFVHRLGVRCRIIAGQMTTRLRDNTTIRRLSDERGVSYIVSAVFLGTVLGPLLALGIEIGRYAETRVLVQQAADLAALAATQEVDFALFQETGQEILVSGRAQQVAQDYLNRNLQLAPTQHVVARVGAIQIAGNVTTSFVEADVTELFPQFVGHVTIQVQGTAEFHFTRDGQRAR